MSSILVVVHTRAILRGSPFFPRWTRAPVPRNPVIRERLSRGQFDPVQVIENGRIVTGTIAAPMYGAVRVHRAVICTPS